MTKRSHKRTEQRNLRSRGLDQMTTQELVRAINDEDAKVAVAVRRESNAIADAIDTIANAFRRGGRLIYVGAGTSGRLALMDASECPPTFGISPRMVRALMAGGRRAFATAVEGAEDSAPQGERDLKRQRVTPIDVVVGISASGSTPYVLGAARLARSRGATIIAVTANRNSQLSKLARISIAPNTGPEILAGSTRMKAGTAQKLVLNMLTTGAIVRLGRVYDNWMIDVALTNEKLRERSLRILEEATGASTGEAKRALAQAKSTRIALIMLKKGASADEAGRLLRRAGGNLRLALNEVSPKGTKPHQVIKIVKDKHN